MVIFDGIGDRPVSELNDRTPLEVADIPALDSLAAEGVNGIMDTISPGIRPGSDTGHLALLGYDPHETYTGRGPFEAAGIDIELEPGDVAFRCNFSTIQDGKIVDRRAGRIKEGTKELAESINGMDMDIDFYFKEAVEHRGVLVFRERDLGSEVTDIDPHACNVPPHRSEALTDTEEDKRTAELLNEFTEKTQEILKDHPVNEERKKQGKPLANIILSRGAGVAPDIKPLKDRTGLDGAVIAGIPLVEGVCKLAGLDGVDVEGATGGMDADIGSIFEGVKEALKDHDFVIVNIKGCDLSGHDGKPRQKKEFIEKINEGLEENMDKIKEELDSDIVCCYTGDHSTPVEVMGHSGDPLPITICGKGVRTDDVEHYDERSCSKGGLNRIKGADVLDILLDLADRAEKFGA